MNISELRNKIDKRLFEVLSKQIDELRPSQEKSINSGLLDGKNLVVCTPTASGKCLDYSSKVQLYDGSLIEIGELYEKNNKNYSIMSLDMKSLKIIKKKPSEIHKIFHNKHLIEVSTGLGKSIRVTPEHPFLVKRSSDLEWVRADSLKEDDFIAVPREIIVEGKEIIFSKEKFLLSFSSCYISDNKLVSSLVNKIDFSYREIAKRIGVYERDLYRWRKKTAIPFDKIIMLSKLSDTSIIERIRYVSDINGMSKLKLPLKMNRKIARLLGLIIGDGSVHNNKSTHVSFTNSLDKLRKEFSSICKSEFNIITRPKFSKIRSPMEIAYSKVFAELIMSMGVPSGKKSHKVTVSPILFKCNLVIIGSFLSGLFDCDSSVDNRGIEYSTDSKELAFGIQTLLLRFGIVSIVKERYFKLKNRYRIFIYRKNNLEIFRSKIRFKHTKKKKKLDEILNFKESNHTNVDVIPFINEDFKKLKDELNFKIESMPASFESYIYKWRKNISRSNLEKLVSIYLKNKKTPLSHKFKLFSESHIFFDRVKDISRTKPVKYVYDLTVPGTQNFIAENIIVHNTLVAEIAMLNNFLTKNKKAIYIVPLKALASEKYKNFIKKYSPLGVNIGISTGDLDSADKGLGKNDIIIATAEKMDSLIRHDIPWIYDVGTVIIDEAHLVNDTNRGPTIEILITMLKTMLKDFQLIALSATIGNPEEFSQWLDAELVIDEWRPVKLRKGILLGDELSFYE